MISLKINNKILKNIEAVIFDKDGTLIDLHYFWGKMTEMRVSSVIKKYSLDNSLFNEICLVLGYNTKTQKMLSDGITALYSRVKIIEIFKNELKKYSINPTIKEIEELFDKVSEEFYKDISKYTQEIKSAVDFAKKLNQHNIKLAIVTSDSIHSTNLTVKQMKWDNLFQTIIGRESHPDTKESGKPTLLALKNLKVNPNNTVMIGDAPMDFISAKNAGIDNTILVASGQISKEDLENTSSLCVNSLEEIEVINEP